MADQVRAGIIGAGFIGAVHAHAVRAAGGLVARVAASTPERSAAAADRLGALGPAATAEELIDSDDVHVVHICTPNSLHTPLAHRTLAAGKPVVCEKPLATTLSDAHSLAAAAGDQVATVPFVCPPTTPNDLLHPAAPNVTKATSQRACSGKPPKPSLFTHRGYWA